MPLSGLLVGLAFGFLLQRGQFCFVCGFRELFLQRNSRFMLALLLAVSIQSVGFFGLQAAGLIRLPTEQMPVLATVLGGLLFGVGIILARCCGSGSWFRSGEGAAGSLLVLLVFAITLAACQAGPFKNLLQPLLQQTSSLGLIHETLGISPWWCVAVLVAGCATLLWRVHGQAYPPRLSHPPRRVHRVRQANRAYRAHRARQVHQVQMPQMPHRLLTIQ